MLLQRCCRRVLLVLVFHNSWITFQYFQIKVMATKGGKNLKDAVRTILSALMSNELQVSLNWTGQNGKMAFGKLQCAEIVRSKLTA